MKKIAPERVRAEDTPFGAYLSVATTAAATADSRVPAVVDYRCTHWLIHTFRRRSASAAL